jgi:hypothetical protein
MALAIKLKSLKDSAENSDGLRILIARYRSRYVLKDKQNRDSGGRCRLQDLFLYELLMNIFILWQ